MAYADQTNSQDAEAKHHVAQNQTGCCKRCDEGKTSFDGLIDFGTALSWVDQQWIITAASTLQMIPIGMGYHILKDTLK